MGGGWGWRGGEGGGHGGEERWDLGGLGGSMGTERVTRTRPTPTPTPTSAPAPSNSRTHLAVKQPHADGKQQRAGHVGEAHVRRHAHRLDHLPPNHVLGVLNALQQLG